MRHEGKAYTPFDPAKAKIDRAPIGEDAPLAALGDEGHLEVNDAHPLFRSLQQRLGTGKVARDALQVFDLLAVSERLLEGFMYDLGLRDELIDKTLDWRDGLYRAIALRLVQKSTDQVIREAFEASYLGDIVFEKALAQLFASMGFAAEQDGVSGRKDVLVVAPVGQEEFRFTVEAKGTQGKSGAIENDAAEVTAAAAHRDQVGRDSRGHRGQEVRRV